MTQTEAPAAAGIRPLPPDPLPFAPGLVARAFVLEREHGNVLVYCTEHAADAVAGHDVRWHYLGHWHEAMWGLDAVARAHGAPILVHAADRAAVRHPDVTTFTGRHALGDGFELVPIPGHTPGATAFLYEHGDHRYLFPGDTLYVVEGAWRTAVLAESDRGDLLDSLDLLRDLDFDVLVPWAAAAGEPFLVPTDRATTHAQITQVMDRLWSGRDR